MAVLTSILDGIILGPHSCIKTMKKYHIFSQGSGQDGGTLPRAIDVIFNSIEDLQTKKYQLKPDKLNGFEIQNEADAAIDR